MNYEEYMASIKQRERFDFVAELRKEHWTNEALLEYAFALYDDAGETITIVRQFHTWAVTNYGVECLTHYYAIPAQRLPDRMWEGHLKAKRWVVLDHFKAALQAGVEYHTNAGTIRPTARNVSNKMRYQVMKRDQFRCCLCGRSAANGSVLEVDHRRSLHHGGSNHADNLWTLCFECNRGKSDDSL